MPPRPFVSVKPTMLSEESSLSPSEGLSVLIHAHFGRVCISLSEKKRAPWTVGVRPYQRVMASPYAQERAGRIGQHSIRYEYAGISVNGDETGKLAARTPAINYGTCERLVMEGIQRR